MGTDEEYLLNVGLWPGQGVDMIFIVRFSGPLPSSGPLVAVHTGDVAVFGNLRLRLLGLGFSAGAEGGDELYTTFVEGQGMTEVDDGIVRAGERQVFWNQADRLDGVPTQGMVM